MRKEHECDPGCVSTLNQKGKRGKLTIYLGAAAGVGKTYAMLAASHERISEGFDVALGWIDSHGQKETEAWFDGLEMIPPRIMESPGSFNKEMDLDAVLKRKPRIVLVDDLAHTNVEGSRHQRRYLDVEELLASGIDVYTTFNIQHLESLRDTVAQITGLDVLATVPDPFVDKAVPI